jgi:hypothetical protein
MAQDITVRFVIDKGLWYAYKAACTTEDIDPFDQLREIVKQWTMKRILRVGTRRNSGE